MRKHMEAFISNVSRQEQAVSGIHTVRVEESCSRVIALTKRKRSTVDDASTKNSTPSDYILSPAPPSPTPPAVSTGMNERPPLQDTEYGDDEEAGSDEDGEDNVMLLACRPLPMRPVSFGKMAASSKSYKRFLSGPNRTTSSVLLAPFESSPRTGSPSTASVLFGETGSETPPALCQRTLESPSGMNDKAGQASTVTLLTSASRSEGSKSDSVAGLPEKVSDTTNASLQEEEESGGGSDCDFEPAPSTTLKLPVKLNNTSASSTAHQKSVQFVQQDGSTTVASTVSPRNKPLQVAQHVVPSSTFTAPVRLGKTDKTPVRVGGMSGMKAVPSEKVVPVKNVRSVKNGDSSSAATKTKKNLIAELHPVSDSTKARRTERFSRLDQNQFWKLSSGTYVEDVLFKRTLFMNATM
ncbi:hypothetical protein BG006_002917, partial [Podila minutissima]